MKTRRRLDDLVLHFPSCAGELWVHVGESANYISSILSVYEVVPGYPRLVNTWIDDCKAMRSPYRIQYGVQNPAARGIILTHDVIIPNFSFTPRLILNKPKELLTQWLSETDGEDDDDVLLLPAVTGMVVRVFFWGGVWHLASNDVLECIHSLLYPWPLTRLFQTCLLPHVLGGLEEFLGTLTGFNAGGLVWFFALYPDRPALLYLSRPLLPSSSGKGATDEGWAPVR